MPVTKATPIEGRFAWRLLGVASKIVATRTAPRTQE
jgi:hypothetical protein